MTYQEAGQKTLEILRAGGNQEATIERFTSGTHQILAETQHPRGAFLFDEKGKLLKFQTYGDSGYPPVWTDKVE